MSLNITAEDHTVGPELSWISDFQLGIRVPPGVRITKLMGNRNYEKWRIRRQYTRKRSQKVLK